MCAGYAGLTQNHAHNWCTNVSHNCTLAQIKSRKPLTMSKDFESIGTSGFGETAACSLISPSLVLLHPCHFACDQITKPKRPKQNVFQQMLVNLIAFVVLGALACAYINRLARLCLRDPGAELSKLERTTYTKFARVGCCGPLEGKRAEICTFAWDTFLNLCACSRSDSIRARILIYG